VQLLFIAASTVSGFIGLGKSSEVAEWLGRPKAQRCLKCFLRSSPPGRIFPQYYPVVDRKKPEVCLGVFPGLRVYAELGWITGCHMCSRFQSSHTGQGTASNDGAWRLYRFAVDPVRPLWGAPNARCSLCVLPDDYTDLISLINELRLNASACRRIGEQAKQYFQQYASPQSIWTHVKMSLDSVAGYLDTWNGQGP